jgi:hypothetical protein
MTALDAPLGIQKRRLGFLQPDVPVPEDFNEMGRSEIEQLFGELH